MIEKVIGLLRPLQFPGAGRLFDPVTPWQGARDITVSGNVRMRLDLANGQQRQMFMGCFARDVQRTVRRLLPPGGTFVDIGANVGYLTLLAADRVGPTGRVIGIEPYPPTFKLLSEQVTRNGVPHVQVHPFALSSERGSLRLYVPAESEHREFNVSMVPSDESTPVDVPCHTLDESFDEWGVQRVDLMKVDVEGAEPFVFRGGARHLTAGVVRHLICEVNGKYLIKNQSSPMGLIAQLKEMGFHIGALRGARVVPLDHELKLESNDEIDGVFVHQSVLDDA